MSDRAQVRTLHQKPVDPKSMWKNFLGRQGDILVLTKPLGTGIISTAIKGELASEQEIDTAVKTMAALNKYARDIAAGFEIHSCTDITGFGLAGHAMEMAKGSEMTLILHTGKLPVLPGVQEYAQMGLIPAGAYRNREYLEADVLSEIAGTWQEDLVYDPQTSGGLMLAVKKEEAVQLLERLAEFDLPGTAIGEVTSKQEKYLILK